jgi:phage FluMu protein Com
MLDKTIHEIFNLTTLYKKLPNKAVIRCKECNTPLKTYYAEERLYLVKCEFCKTVTMLNASSPITAAAMVGEAVE